MMASNIPLKATMQHPNHHNFLAYSCSKFVNFNAAIYYAKHNTSLVSLIGMSIGVMDGDYGKPFFDGASYLWTSIHAYWMRSEYHHKSTLFAWTQQIQNSTALGV